MYLSDKSLAARYQVSRATIWRWNREGKLPRPVKIGAATRWRIADIEQFEKSLRPGAEARRPSQIERVRELVEAAMDDWRNRRPVDTYAVLSKIHDICTGPHQ